MTQVTGTERDGSASVHLPISQEETNGTVTSGQFKKVFFIEGLVTNTWAEWRRGTICAHAGSES